MVLMCTDENVEVRETEFGAFVPVPLISATKSDADEREGYQREGERSQISGQPLNRASEPTNHVFECTRVDAVRRLLGRGSKEEARRIGRPSGPAHGSFSGRAVFPELTGWVAVGALSPLIGPVYQRSLDR